MPTGESGCVAIKRDVAKTEIFRQKWQIFVGKSGCLGRVMSGYKREGIFTKNLGIWRRNVGVNIKFAENV